MENSLEKAKSKSLIKKINSEEVGQIVKRILESDTTQVVHEMSRAVFKYCEKISDRNLEVYNTTIKPLIIKCEFIESKLKDKESLSEEKQELLITDLVLTYKDISLEAKKYKDSNKEKFAILIAGVTIGVVSKEVLKKIFR